MKFDEYTNDLLNKLRKNSDKYVILIESPVQLDKPNENLNDENYNSNLVNILQRDYSDTFVETTNITGLVTDVYDLMYDDTVYKELYFVNEHSIIANINFDLQSDGGIISSYIWQRRNPAMLMYWIFENYLLANFPYIISDNKQTQKAFNFYARFLNNPNVKLQVLSDDGDVFDVKTRDELSQYYGKDNKFGKYRFKLTKV